VAPTGYQHQIIHFRQGQCTRDRLSTVGFDEGGDTIHTGQDVRDHPPGWFTPRVV